MSVYDSDYVPRAIDPERYLAGDYLKDEAEFTARVARLIDMLRSSVKPTRVQQTFEFLSHEDGVYLYPEALKDRLLTRTLEGITITVTKEANEPSTTSVELFDEEGQLHLSRDSEDTDLTVTDTVFSNDGKDQEITRVPDNEINALLLSLVAMPIEAELERQGAADKPVVAAELSEQLERHAVQTQSVYEFELPSGRMIQLDMTQTLSEKMNSFTISYKTGNNRPLRALVDRTRGLEIKFWRADEGILTPLHPDGGDYIQLTEIIDEEITRLIQEALDTEEPLTDEMLDTVASTDDDFTIT